MRRHLSRLFKLLRNGWVITAVVIVAVVAFFIYTRGPKVPSFEIATASIGDVAEKVSVTGKVLPAGKADLAFEKSGVVSRIAVKVGDQVKKGGLIASLNSADDAAALSAAMATLSDQSRSLTPQELAVQKTALANAKLDAENASHDSFIKAQGALFNYADSFFDNPQSVNPTINIRTRSIPEQNDINNQRVAITDALNRWSTDLASISDPAVLVSKSTGYLSKVKIFMDRLSVIVNDLNPGNSGLTQAVIDADVSSINSGLSVLNTAIDSLTAAGSALSAAQTSYDLKLSGNSAESIAAQAAKVAQARANLAKDSILSPIDGLVTRADPDLGEFVSAGQTVFAVQSAGIFKIEAFVPEADIAKVSLGNKAEITLDAYGSDTLFLASVAAIDPAETILEGVPTYKVTLTFDSPDERIRSGMTANTEILTRRADGVVTVPTRAVIDQDGVKSVRVLDVGGLSFSPVPVTVGLKGSDGLIEIKSGLSAGDKVVTYVK